MSAVRKIYDYFLHLLGLQHFVFISPNALLRHWRRCAPSRNHIRVLIPCFILWHVWKALNAYRFDSMVFSVDAVIFRVVSYLKLANFAFGFKTSQLRGILNSRLVEGWRVVTRLRRHFD